MYMSEDIKEKWAPVMEHEDLPEIKDPYRRDVTRQLLENQEVYLNEAAPANSAGTMGNTGGVAKWDPILISLVRRAMPQMIAYDVCGVQPMTGPTGLIFAMKSKYSTQGGTEALFDEADTTFGGTGTHTPTTDTDNPFENTGTAWTAGAGNATATGEALGDAPGNLIPEMAFSIEKTSVTAKTRALRAEYSTELAQDLKAVHGLDAETELANILSTEILSEINREVIRSMYFTAKIGATAGTVTTPGEFDLNTDSNGRWMVEKFKGLLYQIEREANRISVLTRRGKGNFIVTTNDVASALAMAGVLDYAPAMDASVNNDTHVSTMVGTVNGMKVYVDPYYMALSASVEHMVCVGYKGTSPYDAGMFYCPYVPLQMVRAMGENTFQPKIAFKTRYGMVANPYVKQNGTINTNENTYYSKFKVTNLM
mgnify:CR=1 FL=1|jgi:hypothetical protein